VPKLPPEFTLLQVTPELNTGGVEQTTLDIAEAVVKAKGRALVASAGGRLEPELERRGGELVRLPVQSKNPLTLRANTAALKRLIAREHVTLVHARSRAPAFSALGAARARRVPFVATYHGVYSARTPWKRWYNAVMTRGDLVIANSEYTREHVIAEHRVDPDRVVAIPRGVDLERFDPRAVGRERLAALRRDWQIPTDERRTVFLLAGRLTRWKGQALIVEAAQRLKAEGEQDFLVVLAGDDQGRDDYRRELEASIDVAGLREQVRLVGHCADMPAAYLIADVALAPSLRPEAFGRTAVEPQAMGRPVVAAAHGATRETVVDGKTGWIVAPGDPAAWAEAMLAAVAAGLAGRAAMGEAGRLRARRLYSLKAMTDATLKAYLRVLDARSGGRPR
jgi:glycosyltransferase involved in cell wall biosynthesis